MVARLLRHSRVNPLRHVSYIFYYVGASDPFASKKDYSLLKEAVQSKFDRSIWIIIFQKITVSGRNAKAAEQDVEQIGAATHEVDDPSFFSSPVRRIVVWSL